MATNRCPVCGFEFPPGSRAAYDSDGGSFDICPCCGFQYGVTDGIRHETHDSWREKWVRAGAEIRHPSEASAGWSAADQLKNIGIDLNEYRAARGIPNPDKRD
jgi:hypothetical protein